MKTDVKKNGEELIVAVEGEIDTLTSPDLKTAIEENSAGVRTIILDLEKTEYVSSAGLRVFLETKKAMDRSSGKFILRNVNESVMAVLKITGFTKILTID